MLKESPAAVPLSDKADLTQLLLLLNMQTILENQDIKGLHTLIRRKRIGFPFKIQIGNRCLDMCLLPAAQRSLIHIQSVIAGRHDLRILMTCSLDSIDIRIPQGGDPLLMHFIFLSSLHQIQNGIIRRHFREAVVIIHTLAAACTHMTSLDGDIVHSLTGMQLFQHGIQIDFLLIQQFPNRFVRLVLTVV